MAGERARRRHPLSPHTNAAGDVYVQLLGALGIEIPADEREKPSCCDEEGSPPVDVEAAEAIVDAVESRAPGPATPLTSTEAATGRVAIG